MSMADVLTSPFLPLSVGEFLDIPDLVSCERARLFDSKILRQLWNEACRRMLESQIFWNPDYSPSCLDKDFSGKEVISQLKSKRRAVLLSPSWKPWITETSFSSIKVLSRAAPPNRDQTQYQDTREVPELPAKPNAATIPIAVGNNRGENLLVGMKFAAAGPVDDNLCIGIVGTGWNLRCQSVLISFAPFSGRCFIEHDGIAMQTQALPQISQASACSEGYVWCHVTDKGAVRFLRHLEGGQFEDTGLIPHEMLDKCIESYFPAIKIWGSRLEADLDVSVEHSSCGLLADMLQDTEVLEIDTTWSLMLDDVTGHP